MSLIVTGYDLSGGKTTSTEVAEPNNWRVTATITDAPVKQQVFFHFEVEDEQGNWAMLTDDNDRVITFVVKGNGIVSVNPIVVNAANGRIKVKPPTGATGTVNIDSINS